MQHTYTVQYELHHHCHWDTYVYILHMHICKNPCHVYGCTSMKEAWWGDNCFIARRVSTCARERSLKTLKWVQLLPGKGAKFFGSAIFQFIILAEGSWNKLQWFFCTCSQSAPYFMYIFSQAGGGVHGDWEAQETLYTGSLESDLCRQWPTCTWKTNRPDIPTWAESESLLFSE